MHGWRAALALAAAGALGAGAARAGGPGDRGAALVGTSGGPVVAPLPPAGQRAAGVAFMGYRGGDGQSTGALVTLGWSAAFLRAGGELTPWSKDGDARLLWGAGLEVPRPNSFFLHVHDWGPVRPERSFTLRRAEASAGYKLPAACVGPACVAPAVYATVPFDGGAYAGGRAALTLWGSWYAMADLGRELPGVLERARTAPGPAWRLAWSVGRWDGRAGGLFVTYRDEVGMERLRVPGAKDRQGRGALMAGAVWSR